VSRAVGRLSLDGWHRRGSGKYKKTLCPTKSRRRSPLKLLVGLCLVHQPQEICDG
jgi:hypothetical protein